MDLGIKDRVAVITGGDSGMGLKTAEYLLRAGAKVALADLDSGPLQKAADSLAELGEVHPIAADLLQPKDVTKLARAVEERFGPAHILVHAAGITGPTGDFLELTDDDWLKAINTDLMTAVRVCRAFIPGMRQAGWGRIVLFGSEDAEQPYIEELPYCAAKAGILNLTKGLSKSYGKQGVLVNTISPAFIQTPMTDAMMEKRSKKLGVGFDEAVESFLKEERSTMVLQRRGQVDEVASLIAYLCSNLSSFITGSNFRVDGGSVATV